MFLVNVLKWKKVAVIGGIVGGIGVGVLIARRTGLLGIKFTFDCDREMVVCQWWNAWGSVKDWGGLMPIPNQPVEIWGKAVAPYEYEPELLATVKTDTKGNYKFRDFFSSAAHIYQTMSGTAHIWAKTVIEGKEYRTPEVPITVRIVECTGPCPSPTGTEFSYAVNRMIKMK